MNKNKISKKILREFGLLIASLFPVIVGFLIPYINGHSFQLWTVWLALFSLSFALLKPNLLLYPYKFWMIIGDILGWLNSRVILGIVYIMVLIPISLIMKLLGHDPLKQKKSNVLSYREITTENKVDFTKIF